MAGSLEVGNAHPEDLRLIIDSSLGKLLRWLRAIGARSAWKAPGEIDSSASRIVPGVDSLPREEGEAASALFTRAARQGRILITRDKKLSERRDCCCAIIVISANDPKQQMQVILQNHVSRRGKGLRQCGA
eukprot:scaffold46171_cov29-Tisochrysis_lutea.AAC.2